MKRLETRPIIIFDLAFFRFYLISMLHQPYFHVEYAPSIHEPPATPGIVLDDVLISDSIKCK